MWGLPGGRWRGLRVCGRGRAKVMASHTAMLSVGYFDAVVLRGFSVPKCLTLRLSDEDSLVVERLKEQTGEKRAAAALMVAAREYRGGGRLADMTDDELHERGYRLSLERMVGMLESGEVVPAATAAMMSRFVEWKRGKAGTRRPVEEGLGFDTVEIVVAERDAEGEAKAKAREEELAGYAV